MLSSSGDLHAASLASAAASRERAAGRRADAAGGGPRGRSSALCDSTDAPRDADIRSRQDRPQRPSSWAVAASCTWPQLGRAGVIGSENHRLAFKG